MKIREIMRPDVTGVRPDATVAEVVRQMLDQGRRGLPVIDGNGAVLGIVTERDLVAKHAHPHVPLYLGILGGVLPIETRQRDEEMRRVLAVTAADLMTDDPPVVGPDDDVENAADLMIDRDVNPVLVMDGEQLVGIVTEQEFLRLLLVEEQDDDLSAANGG